MIKIGRGLPLLLLGDCTLSGIVGRLAFMKRPSPCWACLTALLISIGCAPTKEPHVASSADQVGYARQVPAQLEGRSGRYQSDLENSKTILDERFGTFVGELSETDWEIVEELYEKSQDEGKSRSYLAHRDEAEAVLGFYESEKKVLVSKVTSAAQHKAEEEGCKKAKLYGAVDWSLQKAVMDRVVERRRESSDAHLLIQREEEKLGKKNTKALEQQADEIMFASYMTHVGAPMQQQELERLVGEGADVKRALSRRIEEINELEDASKEEMKERDELQAALDALDPAVKKAEDQLEDAEQTTLDLQEAYDKAWKKLQEDVRKKLKDAPKKDASQGEDGAS